MAYRDLRDFIAKLEKEDELRRMAPRRARSTVQRTSRSDIFLHRLRKTCATRWQEHGVPIRTIQAWLGHKNLETTMIYLGVTDTEKLGTQVDEAFGD